MMTKKYMRGALEFAIEVQFCEYIMDQEADQKQGVYGWPSIHAPPKEAKS